MRAACRRDLENPALDHVTGVNVNPDFGRIARLGREREIVSEPGKPEQIQIRIDNAHLNDVDLRTMLDAIRTAKDGEYVTVQSNENYVRVAKNAGYLYIHVTDKNNKKTAETKDAKATHESKVEVKVPMKVVDALFSAGKDELDVVAALRTLSANGDTELVNVKDSENTVHIWIDSKNLAD